MRGSSESQAQSLPELSLSPFFERQWPSVYEALSDGCLNVEQVRALWVRVLLAERAVHITGEDPFYLHKLAAAYAAIGDFPKAVETAESALHSATLQDNSALVAELERNISLYRTNTALTDTRQN